MIRRLVLAAGIAAALLALGVATAEAAIRADLSR